MHDTRLLLCVFEFPRYIRSPVSLSINHNYYILFDTNASHSPTTTPELAARAALELACSARPLEALTAIGRAAAVLAPAFLARAAFELARGASPNGGRRGRERAVAA